MNHPKSTPGIPLTDLVAALRETENDFLSWVLDYAHIRGWLIYHNRPAMTAKGWRTAGQGDAGMLDVVLARQGVVILAELKSETGKVRPDQQLWLDASGGYLWRPSDRPAIEEILR